jgi:hypothetical protein
MSLSSAWKSTVSALPWGLVGMLGLVLLVESLVERRAVNITPWGTWAWRISGQAAREQAPGCDFLCFGDSLTKVGILPHVLEDRLGQRAYNLSVCGAQAPASYFLLRRALAAGARPSAVVVDYLPNMLAGGPRDYARHWPELLTLRECLDLSLAAHDASFFASATLGILLPSARARHDIRINILQALRGQGSHLRQSTLDYWQNWNANAGGQATSKNPLYRGDIDPKVQRNFLSHIWWCNRVNAAYIRRFLALAEHHGIHVYWLLPPIAPVVQNERNRTGSDEEHTRYVRGFQEQFPNLTVIDGRRSQYDHTVFFDPIHLDREGACTLTAEIADIISRTTSEGARASRWVHLPPFRERPTNVAIAEIVDLGVALRLKQGRAQR